MLEFFNSLVAFSLFVAVVVVAAVVGAAAVVVVVVVATGYVFI